MNRTIRIFVTIFMTLLAMIYGLLVINTINSYNSSVQAVSIFSMPFVMIALTFIWRWALRNRVRHVQSLLLDLSDAEQRELMHQLTRYSGVVRTGNRIPARLRQQDIVEEGDGEFTESLADLLSSNKHKRG
jgi:hypothetical protein